MARTTTKSNSTYRGYSAKPQSTKSSYVPTRQATSSADNSWAQRLLEEERKKQAIADNKIVIAQVNAAESDVKQLRNKIAEAEAMLGETVTGEQYAKYRKILSSQDAKLQQISDELNQVGAEAAKNIQKNGEGYIYHNTDTNPNKRYTSKSNGTLSVNTDDLKKLQSLLEDIEEQSRGVETKVAKIISTSSEVGIKTGTNANAVKSTTNAVTQLKNDIEQQIRETEKTESENLSIIDKIAKWAGNLFKTSDSEAMKTDNSNTRTTTISARTTTTTSTRTTTPDNTNTSRTKANGINYSRTTTMNIILELAKEAGIDTNGKTRREILEELAEKYNIDIALLTPKTQARLGRNTMD